MRDLGTRATDILGIRYPVVQAPMAGGVTTPRLVAAVSNAGGLGSLGAAYMPAEAIREAVREIRDLTDHPFAVNLFVTGPFEVSNEMVQRSNALMQRYRNELEIEAPSGISSYEQPFEEQISVVLEERVPVFSFTFGTPPAGTLRRLRENGTAVIGTATTVREGTMLQESGVDLVVGQGSEAGAHRGTFAGAFEDSMVGSMALIPQLSDNLEVPIIAAGGIMDGRGLAAALMLGAEAAQMGTAFLTCEESGAHPEYKKALLEATDDATTLTRVFSGRPARGIKNRFLVEMSEHEEELPPYPVQNALTKDIRDTARRQDRPEFFSLWAGQAARLSRSFPATELVELVVEEASATLGRGRFR